MSTLTPLEIEKHKNREWKKAKMEKDTVFENIKKLSNSNAEAAELVNISGIEGIQF